MRPRGISLLYAAVLSLGLLGACAAEQSDVPQSQAVATSHTGQVTTTTTPRVVTTMGLRDRGTVGLYRVDPVTLEPLPGLQPLTTGDWLTGRFSPNAEWLALTVWIDTEPDIDIVRVLDLPSGRVVTEVSTGRPLLDYVEVADDGTVYHLDDEGELRRLERGARSFQPVIPRLPAEFQVWDMEMLAHNRLGFLGTMAHGSEVTGALVMVEPDAGLVTEVALPDLAIGATSETDMGEWNVVESLHPTAVWDTDRDRVFVIHVDAPLVSEVDLAAGQSRLREWSPRTSALDSLMAWLMPSARAKGPEAESTVSGALSVDDVHLFIASARAEVVADNEGGWSVVSVPQGIDVIDTRSWESVARLDIPVSRVTVSPDGRYLVGGGVTLTGTMSSSVEVPEGAFVIDTETMELVGHVESPGTGYPDIQFSADSAHAYLNHERGGVVHVVELASATVVSKLHGPEQLTMFGEAALLSTSRR